MRAATLAAVTTVLLLGTTRSAAAQYPPIENRDFALDVYQGSTVASYRIVGMGGTSLATAEGAPSMSSNPASVASRLATWNDWFEWDWTVDAYNPDLGTDHDNNGIAQSQPAGTTVAGNAGIMMYLGEWGVGFSVVDETHNLELPAEKDPAHPDAPPPPPSPGKLSATVLRLSVGRSFFAGELTFGLSLTRGGLTLGVIGPTGAPTETLVDTGESSTEVGFLWRPPRQNLRVGARLTLPLSATLDYPGCKNPLDCRGYILPERVEFPWSAGVGVAWRRGPTPWNIAVHDDWRDEKSLILAADVLVTGAVDDGAGVEAYLSKLLQPSGREVVMSLRGGAEYEWVPGWFRVRGGLYWEPGRFTGVSGRVHVTAGLDMRIWSFCFWGDRYRLRLSTAYDMAPRYANVIASLGFWH